jgi:outer membrane receptor protein involved in Fe transport
MRAGRDESRNNKAGAEAKSGSHLFRIVWIVLLLAGAVTTIPGRAATTRTVFDIPAGEFEESILVFGRQANVEVAYGASNGGTFKGIHTRAVTGEMEMRRALSILLAGTDLVVEWESDQSVVIRKTAAPAAPAVSVVGVKGHGAEVHSTDVSANGAGQSEPKIAEVLITGTLIHGAFDMAAPLTTVGRKELEQAPYATVEDGLASLPFNMRAPQSEDAGGMGNYNRGVALNLRGLGPQATLVLVDGNRQPAAGYFGDFVDVSNIPTSVIERIEVLPDGASALYGSDAIAGVVNIIMRDDLEGAETQLRGGKSRGGGDERVFAQLFGHRSESGHWLAAYQYLERTALPASERTYANNVDKQPQGGTDFRTEYSNPGNILDPITHQVDFAIPSGQAGKNLTAGQLLPGIKNLENYFSQITLLPDVREHSLFFTGTTRIGDHMELFGEAHYTQRNDSVTQGPDQRLLVVPRSNPFFVDPFGHSQSVLVAYSFMRELGNIHGEAVAREYSGVAGIRANVGRAWHMALSGSRGQEDEHWKGRVVNPIALNTALADPNPATAFDPFGDGSQNSPATLDSIRTLDHLQAISTITTATISADGPLFQGPVGDAKLAMGVERRWERLDRASDAGGYIPTVREQYGRWIDSSFLELAVPLLGDVNDSRVTPRADLSMAGRYERYSDSGSAFSPRVGLSWLPIESLKLRASWSRSFRAPKLTDLHGNNGNEVLIESLPDPRSPSGQSLAVIRVGINPALANETATTWLSGFDFTPAAVPGMRVSLSYYYIDYRNRISQPDPPIPLDILLQEDEWAAAITRNPSPSLVKTLCTSQYFEGSAADCLSHPPTVVVDTRPQNLATTRMRGFDLNVAQSLDTRFGKLQLDLTGAYVATFLQQATATAPKVNVVDTVGNPLSLRMRITADWYQNGPDLAGFNANSVLTYAGSYRDVASQPSRRVGASAIVNLQAGYCTRPDTGWLGNARLLLRVTNLFDTAPPFANTEFGYDIANAQPYARTIGVFVEKSWR